MKTLIENIRKVTYKLVCLLFMKGSAKGLEDNTNYCVNVVMKLAVCRRILLLVYVRLESFEVEAGIPS